MSLLLKYNKLRENQVNIKMVEKNSSLSFKFLVDLLKNRIQKAFNQKLYIISWVVPAF